MISRFLALLLVLHLSLMQVFASQVDSQSVDIEGSSTGIDAGLTNFGVGVNVQTQEAEGDRTNVGTQAAIRAQEGFDIDVEGTTTLEGGVIEGSDNPENNSLETGNLEFSDVDVGSQFSAETSSAGINSNGSLNIAPTQEEEGSDSGTVRSAISQGEIEITNPDDQTQDIASLSRDTDNTNVEIEALPDLEQTLADQATVIANYQASARFVAQTTGDIADALEKRARERGDTETAELFKEGGVGRALLHAAGGALVGGIDGGTAAIAGGAVGGFTASLVGPLIDEAVREALAEQGVTDFSEGSQGAYFRNLLTSVLTTGVAGAAGGNAGAAFGSSVDAYNRLLHRSEIELIQDNAVDFAIEQGLCTSPASCTQEDIDQARGILTAEALSQVDGAFVGLSGNDAAQTFLAGLGQGNAIEGTGQFLFQASGADFNNTALNSEFLIDNSDLYDAATVYGNKPYSNVVDTLTTALANVRQDQSLAPQSVAQLRGQIADLDEAEFRDLLFTTSYNNGDGANVVGLLATQLVLEASQTRPDFQSVLFETIREVGEQQQEDREEIIAIADGIANKISNGEALTADEAIFSATFLAAGASNSLRGLPKLLKSAVGQRLSRIFTPNRVATGNSSVDDFVNTRTGGSPRTNVDGEAGNPVGPQGRIFNAQELEDFAPTIAQRNPTRLNDGSLIDNQGFVYTRNANGSVTSRVASQDQLSQSGQRLDFDNISTANTRQSAIPRNQNEQLAFDHVRANPNSGQTLPLSNDARFTSNGFEKMSQSVPGPNGRNINIHYQYNPSTGRLLM